MKTDSNIADYCAKNNRIISFQGMPSRESGDSLEMKAGIRKEASFTLIEMLVVIGAIVLLAAILIPDIGTALETAKRTGCANNLRLLGVAFTTYAVDNNDCLPPYESVFTGIAPYLDQSTVATGTITGNSPPAFGADYMRCPSSNPKTVSTDNYTYGVNYPYVIGYSASAGYGEQGGGNLHKLPSTVFVAADAKCLIWAGTPAIYYPGSGGDSPWTINIDTDNDGLSDSFMSELPYNGWRPVHRGGGNVLFVDGSVQWVSIKDWETDANGIWGTNSYSAYH